MADSTADSRNRWIKCVSASGNLRGVAIQATSLVQEVADRHDLAERGRQGLGEAMIGALTLASYCKSGERVNLNVQGTGYFQQALIDAYPEGKVRGYVIERQAPLTTATQIAETSQEELSSSSVNSSKGKDDSDDTPRSLRESGPWGEGLLSVLRTRELEGEQGKKQPYVGTVPLLTGHLAKDLSFYWVQSEQVPSAVGLAVATEGKKVKQAGGFLVQAMPGASSDEVRMLEKHINDIDSLAKTFLENENPVHLLSKIFQDTSFMLLEEKSLRFECTCSLERVERALTLIGPGEMRSLLDEEGEASVRCDFCSQEYKISGDHLQELINRVSAE